MPTPAANGVLVAVAARDLLGILIVIGLELGLVAAIGGASYVVATWSTGRLREAGERFCAENPDVLGETEIDGIVAFGTTTMTVRTSTRVRPGRHDAAAAALRFSIKEAFDRRRRRPAAGTGAGPIRQPGPPGSGNPHRQ